MRETQFIAQNKNKWENFEKIANADQKDPEKLSDLFVEITDDLSYARSFYPNRSVRVYLNGIAQKVFYSLYKNKGASIGKFLNFWVQKAPQVLYESRRELFLACMIFMLSVTIGVFSSLMDTDFPALILGEDYVQQTMLNIQSGQPMSVYASSSSDTMFMGIATNNLRVAALTFVLGLMWGLGSIYLLLYNGIMVGAFQTLFFNEGIYLDSVLTIWVHGALEISCIIIAGAAGLVLGKGLVFPQTFTRIQSLQLAARRGVLIMLTIAPLIVLAAFIESFITRFTGAPYALRGLIILLSLAYIVFFFIIYPRRVANRSETSFLREAALPASRRVDIDLDRIKNIGEVFNDTFDLYRKNAKVVLGLSFILSAVYTTVVVMVGYDFNVESNNQAFNNLEAVFKNAYQFIFPDEIGDVLWLMNAVGYGLVAMVALGQIRRLFAPKEILGWKFWLKSAFLGFGGAVVLNMMLNVNAFTVLISVLFLIPMFVLWQSAAACEDLRKTPVFRKVWGLGLGNYGAMMGSFGIVLGVGGVVLLLATAPIMGLCNTILTTFIPMSPQATRVAQEAFYIFVNAFVLFAAFPLFYYSLGLSYFSFKETTEASDLLKEIPKVGMRRISYGMERE